MPPTDTATAPATGASSPSPTSASRHDVVIIGGGLAGLTLALQLRQRFAGIDVLVVERKPHPVPVAAHKVGESTVEIGAHYLGRTLGLQAHLESAQLRKFGFRFFFSDGERDLTAVTEVGASRPLAVPSWQIDRGIFENFLGQEASRRGVRFESGATVRDIALAAPGSGDAHRLHYDDVGGASQAAEARWLVDAGGRAGHLRKKLGLAEANGHDANAVWFRVAARIAIDDWPGDLVWKARCAPPARWLSTNHLVGAGYWVWLIPLASGSHSVGIVCDASMHPLASMNTFDKAMDWLAVRQPRLHEALDGLRDRLQDFAFFRRYSYGCAQLFSAERWALTGEAGLFLDPFYSPGTDFIAIANSYICELVGRDRAARPIGAHAQLYDRIFHSFYESTLALYEGQYALFGDAEVMPVKVLWDYTYYWSVLAQFFCQGRIADLAALSALRDELGHCQALNVAVQALLRDWSAASERRNPAAMLDQAALPWFAALNRSLADDALDDAAFRDRIRASTALMRRLAGEIRERAAACVGGDAGVTAALDALLAEARLEGAVGSPSTPLLFAEPEASPQPSRSTPHAAATAAAA